MMDQNIENRIPAKQALQHPYFTATKPLWSKPIIFRISCAIKLLLQLTNTQTAEKPRALYTQEVT